MAKRKKPTSKPAKKPRKQSSKKRIQRKVPVECVDLPEAEMIVMGCAGGQYDVDTPLGDLFPAPARREQFCQCVADGSGVPRPRIPCAPSTTLGEVIAAIAC